MNIEAVGIYEIKAKTSCYLIELKITNSTEPLDIGKITQPIKGKSFSDWQSPYKEYLLDYSGNSVLSEEWEMLNPQQLTGSFRLTFFFHFLDKKKPISTQYGELELPKESTLPDRLKGLLYTEPD
jgi:hypothetical protein